jgi:hypothetical protein
VDEGQLTLNNKSYGPAATIAELVGLLQSGDAKGWPVPLTTFVPNGDGQSSEPLPTSTSEPVQATAPALAAEPDPQPATQPATPPESNETPPSPPPRPSQTGPPPPPSGDATSLSSVNAMAAAVQRPPWLHATGNDTTTLELMERAGLTDGLFLVRPSGSDADAFVLDMAFRGMVTHHLIKEDPESGRVTINEDSFGGDTLVELIDVLCEPNDKWPCTLSQYVPSDGSRPAAPMAPPAKSRKARPPTAIITEEASVIAADAEHVGDTNANAFKCGECGANNPAADPADQRPRRCESCGKQRARRRNKKPKKTAKGDSSGDGGDGNGGGPEAGAGEAAVPPELQEARENLHQAVQVLSAYRQQKLYEVLAKFVNRKWSLASMVTGMFTVLLKLSERERVKVEFAVGKLIPKSAKSDYYSMLDRQKLEHEMSELISKVKSDEQAFLVRYVTQGIQALRGDARPLEQISSFDRRIHHASTMRGWAAVLVQAKRGAEGGNFQVEQVAKHVHIGWSRAISVEWDPAYGLEPIDQLILRPDGLLDVYNFSTTEGYRLYCERVGLAKRRYLLPHESAAPPPTPAAKGGAQPPAAAAAVLSESQKHQYRATAEILLHAFFVQKPGLALLRGVDRMDDFAIVELRQLGVIQPPPKPKPPEPLSPFQESMFAGRGQRSLTGRVGALLTPSRMAGSLPVRPTDVLVGAADGGGQNPLPRVSVRLELPLGIKVEGTAGHGCFVASCKPGGSAAASGKVVPGMRVVGVHGESTAGLDKVEVVARIAASEGSCALDFQLDLAGFRAYQASKGSRHGGGAPPPSYSAPTAATGAGTTAGLFLGGSIAPWFHGEASKAVAGSILEFEPDGTFLIRQRPQRDEFALALMHKGVVTHHLIAVAAEGGLTVGSYEPDDVISVVEVVDALRVPTPGWPQPLLGFVPYPGCPPATAAAERRRAEQLLADKQCANCLNTCPAPNGR